MNWCKEGIVILQADGFVLIPWRFVIVLTVAGAGIIRILAVVLGMLL